MNGTTMGLRISSRYLCAFKWSSIKCNCVRTYACPNHNPTATIGHSVYNVDISKPLAHMTSYTLSAMCPVQLKPWFTQWRAHFTSIPVAIEGEHLPTEVSYDAEHTEVHIQNTQYRNSNHKTLKYRLITVGIYNLQRECIYISRGRDSTVVNTVYTEYIKCCADYYLRSLMTTCRNGPNAKWLKP
jgi:hypothetical protein